MPTNIRRILKTSKSFCRLKSKKLREIKKNMKEEPNKSRLRYKKRNPIFWANLAYNLKSRLNCKLKL